MAAMHKTMPEAQAILWGREPFTELVGVAAVRTKDDYERARGVIEVLLDANGVDHKPPLGRRARLPRRQNGGL